MNLQITGSRKLIISPAVKALVQEKLKDKLDKLVVRFEPLVADVIIDKDKFDHYTASFDLIIGKEKIFAKTTHINLESALVDLSEDISRQIKRHKASLVSYSLG